MMDCGLYYSYGSAQYAECQNRNSIEQSAQAQAQLYRFTNYVNTTSAQERQAEQQDDASIQLQRLLQALQNQREYGK